MMNIQEWLKQIFTDGLRITIVIEPNDKTYESYCPVCEFRSKARTEQGAQDALKQTRAQCRRDDCPAYIDMPDWLMQTRKWTDKK